MYPSVGAVAAKMNGPNQPGMPAFVAIPQAMTVGIRPGYHQLGIDPTVTHLNHAGRPIPVLSEGEVIRDLV